MSNNPAKYEELIKQYLHSILDISANVTVSPGRIIVPLYWTKYVVPYQINPDLSLEEAKATLALSLFALATQKITIIEGQLSFDCCSYCRCSYRMQQECSWSHLRLFILKSVSFIYHQHSPVNRLQCSHVNWNKFIGSQQHLELDRVVLLQNKVNSLSFIILNTMSLESTF